MPRRHRVAKRGLGRLCAIQTALDEIFTRNDREGTVARFSPSDAPVIHACVFLVQQLHIVSLALNERARRRLLRGRIRVPLPESRRSGHTRDFGLVRRRGIRAQPKLHCLITTHRKGVTARHLRHDETGHACSITVRPVLRETLEARDELATRRLVRIVRIRGQRRDRRTRDAEPVFLQQRSTRLRHASRIQPRARHDLSRTRSTRPLQFRPRTARLLDVFQPQIHLLARLQFDLPRDHRIACLWKRPMTHRLIIHPKRRRIIRREIKHIRFAKLRLDLPRPHHRKRVRICDRRPRRNGRPPIKIHRRIRPRRDQRGEGRSVIVLPRQPRARLRESRRREQEKCGSPRTAAACCRSP